MTDKVPPVVLNAVELKAVHPVPPLFDANVPIVILEALREVKNCPLPEIPEPLPKVKVLLVLFQVNKEFVANDVVPPNKIYPGSTPVVYISRV